MSEDNMEFQQAPPEMQLFFERLLEIKEFVKDCLEETSEYSLQLIYEKLDALIKEANHA